MTATDKGDGMRHHWVLGTIIDLQSYARLHNMNKLYDALDHVIENAATEILHDQENVAKSHSSVVAFPQSKKA